MNSMSLTTLERGKTTIDAAALEALSAQLRGTVLREGDAAYDDARSIWNAMIDRRPGLIVRCVGAADVIAAVNFARENRLLVSVRGGGHNIAGSAVCDGGLMIDLSPMKSVRVDPATRRAWVEPGATLADVDQETQAFGLAVPTGINSTTGICRPDAGRRLRLDHAQIRPDHRQSSLRRCGHRRWQAAARQPDRKSGPVLGAARRRRQFRRRHGFRVPAPPVSAAGSVGACRSSLRRCRKGAAGVSGRRSKRRPTN